MAYDRNKILIFGLGGIAFAAILITVFLPARVEVGVNSIVALQEIPNYGFQSVLICPEQTKIVHLNVTLDSFEIRTSDGEWSDIEIEGNSVSINLLRDLETSFTLDVENLDYGFYNAVRFRVVRGFEYSNATLGTGETVFIDVPDFKVEYLTPIFEVSEGTGDLSMELLVGSGILSNYLLPDSMVSIGTMRVQIIIS